MVMVILIGGDPECHHQFSSCDFPLKMTTREMNFQENCHELKDFLFHSKIMPEDSSAAPCKLLIF